MASEKLLGILEQLGSDELQKFQWYLNQGVEKFVFIAKCKLEGATRTDTVDVMKQTYKTDGAVKVTHLILDKMKLNELADQLKMECGEAEAALPNFDSTPHPPGKDFLLTHRAALATRINTLRAVLRGLQHHHVLSDEDAEEVDSKATKTLKNEALLAKLFKKGEKAQAVFYKVLKDSDRYMVDDLEENNAKTA